ncbi:MAG TPA: hypothetical protein PK458_20415 [Phycisphaerae bacterium]|nr:hypothetical protein [Phycisphaerae bacterium]
MAVIPQEACEPTAPRRPGLSAPFHPCPSASSVVEASGDVTLNAQPNADPYNTLAFAYGLMSEAWRANGAWGYRLFDNADEVRLARELIEREGCFELQPGKDRYPLVVVIRKKL